MTLDTLDTVNTHETTHKQLKWYRFDFIQIRPKHFKKNLKHLLTSEYNIKICLKTLPDVFVFTKYFRNTVTLPVDCIRLTAPRKQLMLPRKVHKLCLRLVLVLNRKFGTLSNTFIF